MCSHTHKDLLSNLDVSVKGVVSLGKKEVKLKIVGAGFTNLPWLGRTLLVPNLSVGLISIPTLGKVGCVTVFVGGKVYVFMGEEGSLILTGTLINGLYNLNE